MTDIAAQIYRERLARKVEELDALYDEILLTATVLTDIVTAGWKEGDLIQVTRANVLDKRDQYTDEYKGRDEDHIKVGGQLFNVQDWRFTPVPEGTRTVSQR